VEIAAPGAVRLEPEVLVQALGDQGLLRVVAGCWAGSKAAAATRAAARAIDPPDLARR